MNSGNACDNSVPSTSDSKQDGRYKLKRYKIGRGDETGHTDQEINVLEYRNIDTVIEYFDLNDTLFPRIPNIFRYKLYSISISIH